MTTEPTTAGADARGSGTLNERKPLGTRIVLPNGTAYEWCLVNHSRRWATGPQGNRCAVAQPIAELLDALLDARALTQRPGVQEGGYIPRCPCFGGVAACGSHGTDTTCPQYPGCIARRAPSPDAAVSVEAAEAALAVFRDARAMGCSEYAAVRCALEFDRATRVDAGRRE